MNIGIPKEAKKGENRVALIPEYVQVLVRNGHRVYVQRTAGDRTYFLDESFEKVGATMVDSIEEVYQKSELVLKVKEPQKEEVALIREGQILFGFMHLSAGLSFTKSMRETGCIALAYETLQLEDGRVPILVPMSAIAGKLSVQLGMQFLERSEEQGRGVLLGAIPGADPGEVLILGGGIVGTFAAQVASALRAQVTLLDLDLYRLRSLANILPANVRLLFSNEENLLESLNKADLVISAVHSVGRKAPTLILHSMLKKMKSNSVFVDVAVDQGGTAETTRPTTHENPTFLVDEVIHYCVPNIPSLVSRTATESLSHSAFPFIQILADRGFEKAFQQEHSIQTALNLYRGKIVHKSVAESFGLEFSSREEIQEEIREKF